MSRYASKATSVLRKITRDVERALGPDDRQAQMDELFDLRPQLRPIIDRIGQVRAGELSGIPQQNISSWLTGHRRLSADSQIRLAVALGCKVRVTVSVKKEVE